MFPYSGIYCFEGNAPVINFHGMLTNCILTFGLIFLFLTFAWLPGRVVCVHGGVGSMLVASWFRILHYETAMLGDKH